MRRAMVWEQSGGVGDVEAGVVEGSGLMGGGGVLGLGREVLALGTPDATDGPGRCST
jgi:hypothetical protein